MHILLRAPSKCRLFTGTLLHSQHVCAMGGGVSLTYNNNSNNNKNNMCRHKAIIQKRSFSKDSFFNIGSTNPLITHIQQIMESFHDYSMLPWGGLIIGGTLVLRTLITLPLAVKQQKAVALMELLKPQLASSVQSLKDDIFTREKNKGKSNKEIDLVMVKEVAVHIKNFYKTNEVHRGSLYIAPFVQLQLWVITSLAMRNISGYGVEEVITAWGAVETPVLTAGIQNEGLLWLSDLSLPDECYVLPVIFLLTNVLNIHLNSFSSRQKSVTRSCEVLAVVMTYVATQMPSAVTLYWMTSSTCGLVQNVLMKYPRVRRLLGIPKSESELEQPLAHYKERVKINMNNFVKLQQTQEGKKTKHDEK